MFEITRRAISAIVTEAALEMRGFA